MLASGTYKRLTFPQHLQWCRLRVNVNFMSHCIQLEASASGSHTGATLPSSVIAMSGLMLLGGATRLGAGEGGIASVAAATMFTMYYNSHQLK